MKLIYSVNSKNNKILHERSKGRGTRENKRQRNEVSEREGKEELEKGVSLQ